jgi:hypothetical protein
MGSGRDKGQNWLVDGVLPTHAANGDCGMNGAPKIWLGEELRSGGRLPECDGGAGRVEEDAEVTHLRDFGDVLHDLGTERFCFGGGGREVVYLNVGEPGRGRSRDGVLHHAAAGAFAGLDDGVGSAGAHVHVFECPGEETGVEGLGFGQVGGGEFQMTEGICHECVLSTLR